jgi:16S rRNA (guanine966-N2)-methyltransferase
MRIIAGSLKGRSFESPRGHKTHPMSEKMRGALFNVLGDISGLTLFDAFAGTGAVGFEAISRGAASVVATDNDATAIKTIMTNIKQLNLEEQAQAYKISCVNWFKNYPHKTFDIIVADPPYEPKNLDLNLVFKLAANVKQGGTFVVSYPTDEKQTKDLRARQTSNLEFVADKHYGDGSLAFYKKI